MSISKEERKNTQKIFFQRITNKIQSIKKEMKLFGPPEEREMEREIFLEEEYQPDSVLESFTIEAQENRLDTFVRQTKQLNEQLFHLTPALVTANVRVCIDPDLKESVLVEENAKLLRTKQQGYISLRHFPEEITSEEDREQVIKVCQKIEELEYAGILQYYGAMVVKTETLARAFVQRNIMIGDSQHHLEEPYTVFVDGKTVKEDSTILNPNVKALIDKHYINKK